MFQLTVLTTNKWLNKEKVPGIEVNEDQVRTLRVLFDFVNLNPAEILELGKEPKTIAFDRTRSSNTLNGKVEKP